MKTVLQVTTCTNWSPISQPTPPSVWQKLVHLLSHSSKFSALLLNRWFSNNYFLPAALDEKKPLFHGENLPPDSKPFSKHPLPIHSLIFNLLSKGWAVYIPIAGGALTVRRMCISESMEVLRNRAEILNMISDSNMKAGEVWVEGRCRSYCYIWDQTQALMVVGKVSMTQLVWPRARLFS